MSSFFISVIFNLFDYIILSIFLENTSSKYANKDKRVLRAFVLSICVIVVSVLNLFHIAIANLFVSMTLIFLYSLIFSFDPVKRVIIVICYVGMCFVTEPIGMVITRILINTFSLGRFYIYYIAVSITLLIRFAMMLMITKYLNASKSIVVQKGMTSLVLTSLLSMSMCIIIVNLISYSNDTIVIVMSVLLIIMVLSDNLILLNLFQHLSSVLEENHRKNMLVSELRSKEEYYKQVEEANQKVLRIKHDFKNKMLSVRAVLNEGGEIEGIWGEIQREIEEDEKKTYTNNVVIQTVLGHKIALANEQKIQNNVRVMVPRRINIEYQDAGILFGNILDNAIEATQSLDIGERWIRVEVLYKEGMLFILVANSKEKVKVNLDISSKADKLNHGYGLTSVEKVVKKYNGYMDIVDNIENIEVSIMLYGIQVIE